MENKNNILNHLNAACDATLMEHLGIVYTDVGEDFLVAEMCIQSNHHQPMGILHGGASVALGESVGSALSFIKIDMNKYIVKGLNISANHISSVSDGKLIAKAVFIHKGKNTHVVNVEIKSDQERLICACRLTNVIIPK